MGIFDIDWKGLGFSFAYLVVLIGSLTSFSTIYRRRKTARTANLEPWFGPHLQRDIYLSLLHMDIDAGDAGKADADGREDGKKKKSTEKEKKNGNGVPDSLLRAALLRRAVEDINRLIQVRTAKQALAGLLARGCVGDDLWQRFQRAEKEMEEELRDVVAEADAFTAGWGASIFQTAHEMTNNLLLRTRIDEILSQTQPEMEWWDKRRAAIEADFMRELDEDDEGAVLVDGAAGRKKGAKK